jgi:hypothetical protein
MQNMNDYADAEKLGLLVKKGQLLTRWAEMPLQKGV